MTSAYGDEFIGEGGACVESWLGAQKTDATTDVETEEAAIIAANTAAYDQSLANGDINPNRFGCGEALEGPQIHLGLGE